MNHCLCWIFADLEVGQSYVSTWVNSASASTVTALGRSLPVATGSSLPIMVTKCWLNPMHSVVRSNANAWSSAMQTSGQYRCSQVVNGVQFRSYEMFDFDMGYEWLEKTGRRGSMSERSFAPSQKPRNPQALPCCGFRRFQASGSSVIDGKSGSMPSKVS